MRTGSVCFEVSTRNPTESSRQAGGYHLGDIDTVISVDDVAREAERIAGEGVSKERVAALVGDEPYVKIEGLRAGYGKMEILHGFELQVGRRQSLCLIGPNGAGKSTVLHSIYGFTNIFSGKILVGDGEKKQDVTALNSSQKLKQAGIAYILQDKSVFPGMTVEENLWMGGYLMDKPAEAKVKAEAIFDKYPRLAERRSHLAKVLSGGERRLLEISRALVMDPEVLLVDEPSIGWSRASWPWPAAAASCSTTPRWGGCSSAVEAFPDATHTLEIES
jgi:branched-chain amino acid transport system ATP-binding protein